MGGLAQYRHNPLHIFMGVPLLSTARPLHGAGTSHRARAAPLQEPLPGSLRDPVDWADLRLSIGASSRAAVATTASASLFLHPTVPEFDQAQKIRRDSHAHRRLGEALGRIAQKVFAGRRDAAHRRQQLIDVGDGVLRLPLVVQEGLFIELGVRRDVGPEPPAQELLVTQR